MAYCGPHGIALSTFLRWDVSDQEAALEWQAYEARRCRSCGSHPEDWAEDSRAHHAHLHQCPGCQQTERLRQSNEAKDAGHGVQVVLAHGHAENCPRCQPLDDD